MSYITSLKQFQETPGQTNHRAMERVPFQVRIGSSFQTLNEYLKYANAVDKASNEDQGKSWTDETVNNSIMNTAKGEYVSHLIEDAKLLNNTGECTGSYYKDTRLGANDVMNTIWQFNRDDDIVHPVMFNHKTSCGMGRVYTNTTYRNQSIAYFTFGVPIFTSLAEFFNKAFDTGTVRYNAVGYGAANDNVMEMVGSGIVALVTVPLLPLKWIWDFLHKQNTYAVNRFYDLRGNMPQYYGYINNMITSWLVNSGMMEAPSENEVSSVSNIAINAIGQNILNMILRRVSTAYSPASAQAFMTNYINSARELASTSTSAYWTAGDPKLDGEAFGTNNIFGTLYTRFVDAFKSTAAGATQFIGFRIEKSVDANESWSNSTTPNSIAEQINSKIASAADAAKSAGISADGGGVPGLQGVLEGMSNMLSGVTSMFGIDNLAALALSGAFIDIPEQYKSSDFSKSHSLNFQLRSPYGDIASIYESIMVPLFCLLAGALPRGAGNNSYMQPFLCRAYCKGLFSIPLGIIDSLTVKRGSSEFGWTYSNLPTCVDVSVSIKDLSPALYMGMATPTLNFFSVNTNFDEYLLTLAGCGLYERVIRFEKLKRQGLTAYMNFVNRTLNPTTWGSALGSTVLPSFVGSFVSGIGNYTNK